MKQQSTYLDIFLAASVFILLLLGISGIGYIQDKRTQTTSSTVMNFITKSQYNIAKDELDVLISRHSWTNISEKMSSYNTRECSTKCLCSNGGLQHYGRFCGYGYYPCEPDVIPCDPLDYCCMLHDSCAEQFGRANCGCTISFNECMTCVYANEISPVPDVNQVGWRCNRTALAIENILSELMFLQPNCFKQRK